MIRITVWDIEGGDRKVVLGDFESLQMTDNDLRDANGNVVLHWFDFTWFDPDGNGWYDWTVEAV